MVHDYIVDKTYLYIFYVFYYRQVFQLTDLENLPTVTLPDTSDINTSTTTLTCDCDRCEQVAIGYCINCKDKICDTHMQVSEYILN